MAELSIGLTLACEALCPVKGFSTTSLNFHLEV